MANKDIIQELNDLGSSLVINPDKKNIYSVPDGYFEDFSGHVLDLIKTNESLVWLSSLPKRTPFQVPVGYFDGLDEKIMEVVHNHADFLTSEEELKSISPLLSKLNKGPVYSVPMGYFEDFNIPIGSKKDEPKVISMTSRKWFRYAAAAVITGVVALAGFMIYNNNNHKDPAGRSLAKFEKDVKKIDDVKKTESLIDFMDAGLNEKELASNHKIIKTDDVQQLLQDVSTDELKDFNEQSKDIEDVMMTN